MFGIAGRTAAEIVLFCAIPQSRMLAVWLANGDFATRLDPKFVLLFIQNIIVYLVSGWLE